MSFREPIDSIFLFSSKESFPPTGVNQVAANGSLERSIRFAEVPDQLAWKRRERIVSLFGPADFREISSSSVEGIMQHETGFDVLICSVDDVGRLRAALRAPADIILKNKLSFAYCEKSSPGRRSQLFKIGFDDVFHSGMSDREIILRFGSIVERYNLYTEISNSSLDEKWQKFAATHVNGSLRRKQKEIVQRLYYANGGVVRYKELANYDYALNEYNISSLKAIVSNIRKKLVGYEIESVQREGYRLVVRDREVA